MDVWTSYTTTMKRAKSMVFILIAPVIHICSAHPYGFHIDVNGINQFGAMGKTLTQTSWVISANWIFSPKSPNVTSTSTFWSSIVCFNRKLSQCVLDMLPLLLTPAPQQQRARNLFSRIKIEFRFHIIYISFLNKTKQAQRFVCSYFKQIQQPMQSVFAFICYSMSIKTDLLMIGVPMFQTCKSSNVDHFFEYKNEINNIE